MAHSITARGVEQLVMSWFSMVGWEALPAPASAYYDLVVQNPHSGERFAVQVKHSEPTGNGRRVKCNWRNRPVRGFDFLVYIQMATGRTVIVSSDQLPPREKIDFFGKRGEVVGRWKKNLIDLSAVGFAQAPGNFVQKFQEVFGGADSSQA